MVFTQFTRTYTYNGFIVKWMMKLSWIIVNSAYRCYNNVELFHNIERVSVDITGRVELDCHERMGRRVYVLYLRFPAGVRVRQLRGQEATSSQRRVPPRREPCHAGNYHPLLRFFTSLCCFKQFVWSMLFDLAPHSSGIKTPFCAYFAPYIIH